MIITHHIFPPSFFLFFFFIFYFLPLLYNEWAESRLTSKTKRSEAKRNEGVKLVRSMFIRAIVNRQLGSNQVTALVRNNTPHFLGLCNQNACVSPPSLELGFLAQRSTFLRSFCKRDVIIMIATTMRNIALNVRFDISCSDSCTNVLMDEKNACHQVAIQTFIHTRPQLRGRRTNLNSLAPSLDMTIQHLCTLFQKAHVFRKVNDLVYLCIVSLL